MVEEVALSFVAQPVAGKAALELLGWEGDSACAPVIADRVLVKNTVTTTHGWQVPVAQPGTAGGQRAPGLTPAAPLDAATLFWEEERF